MPSGRSLLVLAATVAGLVAAPRTAAAVDPPRDKAAPSCPSCVADFALYDPGTSDDGVWDEDVVALESIFRAYGFTWRKVNASDLANGALGSGKSRKFRALVEPGGWAYTRDATLAWLGGVSRV